MTSAIEKDGTEDWITGFYKVAKPGEWASVSDFMPSLCSKEEVTDVINDKIKKLSVPVCNTVIILFVESIIRYGNAIHSRRRKWSNCGGSYPYE